MPWGVIVNDIHLFPKIISHRGFSHQHVENTIPAFKAAIDAHIEMIEIDVHETLDGCFIVYHDDRLNQNSPPWNHLTYSQIRSLTSHDDRAPLLSDCLEAIGSIPVDIEIKRCTSFDNLLETLEASSLTEGSFISSSNDKLLLQLHKRGVQLPLILIVSISKQQTLKQNFQNAILCILPGFLPGFIDGVAVHYPIARKTFIQRVQRGGLKVFVWTVDDPENMEKYVSRRVDGIISNCPKRLQDIKCQWSHIPNKPWR
jgi:glycerophosphoryl diester phosphodiesterase